MVVCMVINLSNARSENESYEVYRERLTTNKKILKTYFTYGREGFREMFPDGVATAMQQAEQVSQLDEPTTEVEPEIEYRLASE